MILKNCHLIPELCEGVQETLADIRIEGNVIAEILPAGGSYVGEEVIDCTGKTVLPGMFNLHNHFAFNTMDWDKIRGGQSEFEHTMNAVRFMNKLLAHGYTYIRDVGTAYNIAVKLRDDINAGKMIGPNIKASGAIITPDMVAPPELEVYSSNPHGQPANDPYLLRGICRRQLSEGADFIKILGCSAKPTSRGDGPLFYPDELEELVNVAKREGTYLAIHTNSPESNDSAIDCEAYTIEHGSFWTEENNENWIAHGKKSAIVPTLTVCMAWGEEFCHMLGKGLRLAIDSGALIGWGTDATEEFFAVDTAMEFTTREKVWGISRVEILKQATINSAKIMKTDAERGTIKVGKIADFAIVDGDPLEDLNVFGKPCAYVLKDGVVVAERGMVKFA